MNPALLMAANNKGVTDGISKAVNIILGGIVIGGIGYGGLLLYRRYKKDTENIRVGTDLNSQAAARLRAAMGYTDTAILDAIANFIGLTRFSSDKNQVYEIAKTIGDFGEVIKAYRALFNGADLNADLRKSLGTEYDRFLSIVNNVKPGATPANNLPAGQWAVATRGTNIRKSPQVIGDGGASNLFQTNNIIGTAKEGEVIGIIGAQKIFDSANNVWFQNVTVAVYDGNTFKNYEPIGWISTANIRAVNAAQATIQKNAYGQIRIKQSDLKGLAGFEKQGYLKTKRKTLIYSPNFAANNLAKENAWLGLRTDTILIATNGIVYQQFLYNGMERWVDRNDILIY